MAQAYCFLSVAVTAAILVLGIWPGLTDDVIFRVVLLTLIHIRFVAAVLGLLVLIRLAIWYATRRRRANAGRPRATRALRLVAAGVAMPVVALILVGMHVPARLAFLTARASMEYAVRDEFASYIDGSSGKYGIYWVDQCAKDSRGGVYFRVYAGNDGIGPHTTSYGFVCQPNSEGTPFGRKHYEYEWIWGDWYLFQASDGSY